MSRYIASRLLQTILVVFGVATVVFVLIRLSGDPVTWFVAENATKEDIQQMRQLLGTDRPLYVQYLGFLRNALMGNFGRSFRFQRPAMELVLERLPATLQLSAVAFAMMILLAIPAGVIAGVKRGSIYDNLCMVGSLLGQVVPTFWLGVMLILLFAIHLKVFPTSGKGGLQHMILPAFTLAAYSAARIARVARSSMLEVLSEEYIRTARAKGLKERLVIQRHALKNASISIVTMAAYMLATLVGGAIITEVVFAWPGIGKLLVDAVYNRDYPLAQATVFVIGVFVAMINLLTDMAYAFLDPRITYK